MGEEFRNNREEHKSTTIEMMIGDRGCQVSFSATIWTDENEPSIGILSKLISSFTSLLHFRMDA